MGAQGDKFFLPSPYKVQQEKIYQDYVSNKSKERSAQLEQYYEHTVTKLQTEVACILQTVQALQNLLLKKYKIFLQKPLRVGKPLQKPVQDN